jgi:hypothetical protein
MKKLKKILILNLIFLSFFIFSFAFATFPKSENFIFSQPPSAKDFAPNFWFDSKEEYFPTDPLEFYYQNGQELPGELAKSKYDNLSLKEKLEKFKVFYEIKEKKDQWIIEYWFFYVFNKGHLNGHYGDWESVFVFLNKKTKKIEKMVASAHWGGKIKVFFANNLINFPQFDHPTLLIEEGSHANWLDGNGDGLVNRLKDCDNWYNAYTIKHWSKEDKLKGVKINYDHLDYKLEELSKLREKLKNKNSFAKSPILKSFSLKIGKEKISFFLSLGRAPSQFPWQKSEYKDPESIFPLTKDFLAKKIKNFFGKREIFRAKIVKEKEQPAKKEIFLVKEVKKEEKPKSKEKFKPLEEKKLLFSKDLKKFQEKLTDFSRKIDLLERKIQKMKLEKEIKKMKKETKKEDSIKKVKEEREEKRESLKKKKIREKTKISEKETFLPAIPPPLPKLIISEVAAGIKEAEIEFVEIFNPNDFEVKISEENFQLKFINCENEPTKKRIDFRKNVILAKGYFLLASTSSFERILADAIFSPQLTDCSGVIIEDKNYEKILDRVAWAKKEKLPPEKAVEKEGIILENGLKTNQSLERKKDSLADPSEKILIDTDNNSADFFLNNSPEPTNSQGQSLILKTEEKKKILPRLLITKVQIASSSSSNDDFVEIYNLATSSIDISDFQLKKKNKEGKESSIKVFPKESKIEAKGYFLWANSDYKALLSIANVTSTQTLAKDNSIALLDKEGNIIDALAWGSSTNPFLEKDPFEKNPKENQILARKKDKEGNYLDTNDNSQDFEIQESIKKEVINSTATSSVNTTKKEIPSLEVVINEIAWMGTIASFNDEWIELYNNTTSTIDLAGWSLKAEDGSPSITFSTGTIEAQGFYLLERTDDQVISDIKADFIFKGSLNDEGEKLELRDREGNLVDLVDCSLCWFAGENEKKQTMERIDPKFSGFEKNNWQSNNLILKNGKDAKGNPINGTPKSKNSVQS